MHSLSDIDITNQFKLFLKVGLSGEGSQAEPVPFSKAWFGVKQVLVNSSVATSDFRRILSPMLSLPRLTNSDMRFEKHGVSFSGISFSKRIG